MQCIMHIRLVIAKPTRLDRHNKDIKHSAHVHNVRELTVCIIIQASTEENVPSDTYAQRIFKSPCTSAQADLNLHWAHMFEGTLSDFAANIIY